jgi:hypothetical protein
MRMRIRLSWRLWAGAAAAWLSAAPAAHAQTLAMPLELRQVAGTTNLQSLRGMPLSSVVNAPPGSDGRLPSGPESGSAFNPTRGQFGGGLFHGGGWSPTNASLRAASTALRAGMHFSPGAAELMQLPRGVIGAEAADQMVLRAAFVGGTYFSRQAAFSFGSIIPPPDTDELGRPLEGSPANYWVQEPHSTNQHVDAGYYWSPHSRRAYAIQTGPIQVTWRRAQPYTGEVPAPEGDLDLHEVGGATYAIYTQRYVVSGTAVKTPRKMYWTEKEFRFLGRPVIIPSARIGGVNIVYNSNFPRTVPQEYRGPGYTSPTEGGTNQPLAELRTLWYDQSQGVLYAHNHEGRVFVELLGDARPDGLTRESLGFEIVDVFKQPEPMDVTVHLGERIRPPHGSADELYPEPVLQFGSPIFGYEHIDGSTGHKHLYAERLTVHQSDHLVHWLETGLQGIQWPTVLGRYRQEWPAEVERYSHYLRPLVATETEAAETAVQLATANVPFLSYQDPLDRPRAKLTPEYRFYTHLDAAQPAHRTLLRFTSGDQVAFERVFSWLDQTLRDTNFTGTVAMDLHRAANHANYEENLAAWQQRVIDEAARYQAETEAYNQYLAALAAYEAAWQNYLQEQQQQAAGLAVRADGEWRLHLTGNSTVSPTTLEGAVDNTGLVFNTGGFRPWQIEENAAHHNGSAARSGLIAGDHNQVSWLETTVVGPGTISFRWQVSSEANYDYLRFLINNAQQDQIHGTVNWTNRSFTLPAGTHTVRWQYGKDGSVDAGADAGWVDRIIWTGNLPSWTLLVDAVDPDSGALVTFPFPGGSIGVPSLGDATPYPSGVTVGGIPHPVVGARVQWDGWTHNRPYELDAFLLGPNGEVCVLMAGVGTNAVSGFQLVFADGMAELPHGGPYTQGTYRPTDHKPGQPLPAPLTGTPRGTSLEALLAEVSSPIPPVPPAQVQPPEPPNPGNPPAPGLWMDESLAPRVVIATAEVGRRINPPAGEPGADGTYVGHINPRIGTLYHPGAYLDPLIHGFAVANQGAIIPVNAVPGRDQLEVWWFRPSRSNAGPNAGNTARGFQTILWPSVLGRYTIVWPENPREIVLASKLGSGTLAPAEAAGVIYAQNNSQLPGYNPNEEHALMAGGTAYATRDDLNITGGPDYSSHPFVLVSYQALDGRPAVSAFKVLREKPEAGWTFDYITAAGQLLQAPMPLPLLAKPVAGAGDYAINYNHEVAREEADLPGGWNAAYEADERFRHYRAFTWRDRQQNIWVYRGQHAGLPAMAAGAHDPQSGAFGPLPAAVAVVGQEFEYHLHATRQAEHLALVPPTNLPSWLRVRGLALVGTPGGGDVGAHTGAGALELIVEDLYDGSRVTRTLDLTVQASGTASTQPALALSSTNPHTGTVVTFTNRPPFLAANPAGGNSFTMRYYYKTEPGFHWPGVANPPPPGSIVPYLRPVDPHTGQFVGDPASFETPALDIVYRPVWPVRDPKDSAKPLPTLPLAATLTKPRFNLPGVRDMLTAEVLYQQSLAQNLNAARASVVLHDATREKTADLAAAGLNALPGGIVTDLYKGLYYFPNLPPHLADRVFFDPNRGTKGRLVLGGRFVEETLGESYLLLNVLRGSDLATVKALCPAADPAKVTWDALVGSLATAVETFVEDIHRPGSHVPDPGRTAVVGTGQLAEVWSGNTAVDSYALSATGPGTGYVTLVEAGGSAFTQPGDPVALHVFRVDGTQLFPGELKVIPSANPLSELITFQHTVDVAGRFDEFEYEWKIAPPVEGVPPVPDATMSQYLQLATAADLPHYTLGGAGIQALIDNYVVMRYRATHPAHPLYNQWSDWTSPKLAEGWIKRVLAGINPFNQRVTDFFNNEAETSGSLLTQAGKRWEGDVALNLDTINNYGLIEIYETVLRRGRQLSIEAGYNFGPANDALLLAAGYLNDLYMLLGGEAWADAANPTIGIGTKDSTYGDVATALFSFKGQVASLLEEELALLRGRDDFLLPGVGVSPVYNRLVWNYTRGINAGEVIYALNYNIRENPNRSPDGIIGAEDAAHLYPQGHGDAYGHYLTSLKGYYSLLMNPNFDWVPRIEAVNVLGQPVAVDYQDERKLAAAAAAVARAGRQIFDLSWRRDYQPVSQVGWGHFAHTRTNQNRAYQTPGGGTAKVVRHWGMDHWATRVGQGAYLNWVVGNAILPAVEPDPEKEGIQKVDRTTVPELRELAVIAEGLQTALDNAEGGLSPLGIPESGIAFDINPNAVVGGDNGTHFEQIYQRAKVALNNAVAAFDEAKDVTRLMRSEQDSLADLQSRVASQELAFNNALIELYGTPYPEDLGPGKTFRQGYKGPDLVHYAYVDLVELGAAEEDGTGRQTFQLDIQSLPEDWLSNHYTDFDFIVRSDEGRYTVNRDFIEYTLGSHGFHGKPREWVGRRAAPGRVQQVISERIQAHHRLENALNDAVAAKGDLDKAINLFRADVRTHERLRGYERDLLIAEQTLASVEYAFELFDVITERTKETLEMSFVAGSEALPTAFIAGMAAGGDLTAPARSALKKSGFVVTTVLDWSKILQFIGKTSFGFGVDTAARWVPFDKMAPLEWEQELRGAVAELGNAHAALEAAVGEINFHLRTYDDAQRKYRALVAEGDRLQEEREVFRKRAAALVQGFRTRDTAFRLFRDEKLERYKTLFDLAARYCLLAANAYDYETGLLGTTAGRDFRNRIINSRALGIVRNGEPLFAGSNTGDPGLSSILAEMKADWDVLRGRLGFNNPDAYGTTVSLRTEALRILPTSDGDDNWKDMLHAARMANLLDDPDVRQQAMQIDTAGGLPVPGLLITFSTTIADGYNLFGRELAAGDHAFSASSFATKIFGVGVALVGYRGMDNPSLITGVISGSGGTSPSDPNSWFLDPQALSATPYVYLLPVGVDSMRSPPLGDSSAIRTWNVEDVAIPMPFNIGASDFSTLQLWQSADSLTEPLFAIRKHQAFRPVSSTDYFTPNLYGYNGTLQRSQYTNNRLVGRSAWNSHWKLVIPGKTLLHNPNEGLDRFIQTVKDIRLHLVTYSYSGN